MTDLEPGTHVRVLPGTNRVAADEESPIGIIDPFLPHPARSGQSCWMLLYPRTVTSMRHDWTHPQFEEQP